MISYVGSDIITCNYDAGVRAHFAQKYAAIPATATLPAVPESYWYSKELVAYIMAILSTSGILYPWYEAVQGGTYWYIPVHPLLDTRRYEKCQNCTYQYIPVRTDT